MGAGASVVLNGSVAAIHGMPGMSECAVGKAALLSLASSLSEEPLPEESELMP